MALAYAATVMFFFLTLVLGVQLLTVNFLAGAIWLIVWAWLLIKLLQFAHNDKLDDCTGYTRD
jgi:hypothetical protein